MCPHKNRPHRGDPNEYTQHTCTILNIKQKITLNYPKSAAMVFFLGTQERVQNRVANEPSVFEPLKFSEQTKIMISKRRLTLS